MKKKIIALICIIVITGMGAFAARQISESTDKANDTESFRKMTEVMEKTITDEDEYTNLMINYMYLVDGYGLTAKEADYIAGLIAEGYDMTEVLECAYFWIDTNEKISIIKEMCDIKNSTEKYDRINTWAEEVFNVVTNEKYGALDEKAVIEYRQKGLTDEDILTANRLCRKGVYTIQEILEKRLNGENFTDITNEIETGTSRKTTKTELPELEKASDVLSCRELGRLNKTDMIHYVERAAKGEDAEKMLQEKENEILETVLEKLKSKKLLKSGNKENIRTIVEEIKENGVNDEELKKLMINYDELEILNAAKVSRKTGKDINKLLEKKKNGSSWQKILTEVK